MADHNNHAGEQSYERFDGFDDEYEIDVCNNITLRRFSETVHTDSNLDANSVIPTEETEKISEAIDCRAEIPKNKEGNSLSDSNGTVEKNNDERHDIAGDGSNVATNDETGGDAVNQMENKDVSKQKDEEDVTKSKKEENENDDETSKKEDDDSKQSEKDDDDTDKSEDKDKSDEKSRKDEDDNNDGQNSQDSKKDDSNSGDDKNNEESDDVDNDDDAKSEHDNDANAGVNHDGDECKDDGDSNAGTENVDVELDFIAWNELDNSQNDDEPNAEEFKGDGSLADSEKYFLNSDDEDDIDDLVNYIFNDELDVDSKFYCTFVQAQDQSDIEADIMIERNSRKRPVHGRYGENFYETPSMSLPVGDYIKLSIDKLKNRQMIRLCPVCIENGEPVVPPLDDGKTMSHEICYPCRRRILSYAQVNFTRRHTKAHTANICGACIERAHRHSGCTTDLLDIGLCYRCSDDITDFCLLVNEGQNI